MLVPCVFFFISLCIAFTFSSILWPYSTISVSILITRYRVFWTLHLISWLSLHCSVLFLDFWSVLSFGPYLSWYTCYIVRCRDLGICQDGATHFVVLWHSLNVCFFFNSLIVGLPYSLIFWQFWLFFVLIFVVVLLLVVWGGKVPPPMAGSLNELMFI